MKIFVHYQSKHLLVGDKIRNILSIILIYVTELILLQSAYIGNDILLK